MTHPRTPTGHASVHYDAGRAYSTFIALAVRAALHSDPEASKDYATEAEMTLWPLAALDATSLRDFIAGLNRSVEDHLDRLSHVLEQRGSTALEPTL